MGIVRGHAAISEKVGRDAFLIKQHKLEEAGWIHEEGTPPPEQLKQRPEPRGHPAPRAPSTAHKAEISDTLAEGLGQ